MLWTASLRKESIDLGKRELRIEGKGGKRRMVPLLPSTAEVLRGYMERHEEHLTYAPMNDGRGCNMG